MKEMHVNAFLPIHTDYFIFGMRFKDSSVVFSSETMIDNGKKKQLQ